jgi:urease accessory protein
MPLKSTAGRHGELNLAFTRRHGRTVMTKSFFRTPLQVMKPRLDETGCLCLYLLSPTGGVVQGDNYQIDINLSAGTHVIFTTQAATKVYEAPSCGAAQKIKFGVGENALLEYLPDATILFRDADFEQHTYLSLARGAKVVLQEIVMPGRLGRGEILAFRRFTSCVEAVDSSGVLLYDAACLQPQKDIMRLNHPVGLEGYPCWGNWYLLGDVDPNQIAQKGLTDQLIERLNQKEKSIGGVSSLHRNGLVIRMLALNAQTIQLTFQSIWNLLKTELLGLKPVDLRKY